MVKLTGKTFSQTKNTFVVKIENKLGFKSFKCYLISFKLIVTHFIAVKSLGNHSPLQLKVVLLIIRSQN